MMILPELLLDLFPVDNTIQIFYCGVIFTQCGSVVSVELGFTDKIGAGETR